MLPKPPGCSGCVLEHSGRGFVPPVGPQSSPILFLAEAPGAREVVEHEPLKGDAGAVHNRALSDLGQVREKFRLANLLCCEPPGNVLRRAFYQHAAVQRCRQYLDPVLREPHRVVVTMGVSAIEAMLPVSQPRVEDFHGTVQLDRTGRVWVVPTYHPSHINRGAWNLYRTFQWDIERALDLVDELNSLGPGGKPALDSDSWDLVVDPAPEWFARWVDEILLLPAEEVWLAVDTETATKLHRKQDEGELTARDAPGELLRINLAVREDQGVTVPALEPYLFHVKRLLAFPCLKGFWHEKFDAQVLREAQLPVAGWRTDWMWAWHVLQSDVPRGLGFVSPFYIKAAAWKHLADTEPGVYGAQDGLRTRRLMSDIAADLQAQGQWNAFWRHVTLLEEYAIRHSEEVGLPLSKERLEEFHRKLQGIYQELRGKLQAAVPESVRPWYPKEGWKTDPGPEKAIRVKVDEEREEERLYPVVKRQVEGYVNLCLACRAEGVHKKHRCSNKALVPQVIAQKQLVDRWYVRPEFNPRSHLQLLALFAAWKIKPGKNRQTGRPSVDRLTVEERYKSAKVLAQKEWLLDLLDFRLVDKVDGTYVRGTLKRLVWSEHGDWRVHPTVTHKPSTLRTSYTNPNLQNLKADRGGREAIEAGFRDCIVAAPGCSFLCPDFAGIEAVITGWLAGDPTYIRLGKLGVHAYAVAKKLGVEVELNRLDREVAAELRQYKDGHPELYDPLKRTIHGGNYGLTPYGMHDRFPTIFPTLKKAQEFYDFINRLFPKVAKWRQDVQALAARQSFLGGNGAHPWGYKHWFWNVYSYRRITPQTAVWRERRGYPWKKIGEVFYAIDQGDDAKRSIAFGPQSIAAGVIKEAALELFTPGGENYIGDAFHGRTPLRAIVHDDLWLEVPDDRLEEVKAKVWRVMTRPVPELPMPEEWGLGKYLSFGVEMKVGKDMGHLKRVEYGEAAAVAGLAQDLGDVIDADEEEYEDPDWQEDIVAGYAERGGGGEGAEDVPF